MNIICIAGQAQQDAESLFARRHAQVSFSPLPTVPGQATKQNRVVELPVVW